MGLPVLFRILFDSDEVENGGREIGTGRLALGFTGERGLRGLLPLQIAP